MISSSMGIPWYKTLFKVIIPMSFDSILEIFTYYFVNSMVTVSAVIFLYSSDLKLASIAMVNMDDAGDTAYAAALAVFIVFTNILLKIIFDLLMIKTKRKINLWKKRGE